jgi:hypothetical protein
MILANCYGRAWRSEGSSDGTVKGPALAAASGVLRLVIWKIAAGQPGAREAIRDAHALCRGVQLRFASAKSLNS